MIHYFYVILKLYIYYSYLLPEDRRKDTMKPSDYVIFL